MYLVLLTLIPVFFSIKAVSYGVYEMKTKNITGGIAVILLSVISFYVSLILIYGA